MNDIEYLEQQRIEIIAKIVRLQLDKVYEDELYSLYTMLEIVNKNIKFWSSEDNKNICTF